MRNCGQGILAARPGAMARSSTRRRSSARRRPPACPWNACGPTYAAGGASPGSGRGNRRMSVIDAFDPRTLRFHLRQPHAMKPGDRFEVIAPATNWTLHDNTLSGCLKPVVLDSYGSETTLFRHQPDHPRRGGGHPRSRRDRRDVHAPRQSDHRLRRAAIGGLDAGGRPAGPHGPQHVSR